MEFYPFGYCKEAERQREGQNFRIGGSFIPDKLNMLGRLFAGNSPFGEDRNFPEETCDCRISPAPDHSSFTAVLCGFWERNGQSSNPKLRNLSVKAALEVGEGALQKYIEQPYCDLEDILNRMVREWRRKLQEHSNRPGALKEYAPSLLGMAGTGHRVLLLQYGRGTFATWDRNGDVQEVSIKGREYGTSGDIAGFCGKKGRLFYSRVSAANSLFMMPLYEPLEATCRCLREFTECAKKSGYRLVDGKCAEIFTRYLWEYWGRRGEANGIAGYLSSGLKSSSVPENYDAARRESKRTGPETGNPAESAGSRQPAYSGSRASAPSISVPPGCSKYPYSQKETDIGIAKSGDPRRAAQTDDWKGTRQSAQSGSRTVQAGGMGRSAQPDDWATQPEDGRSSRDSFRTGFFRRQPQALNHAGKEKQLQKLKAEVKDKEQEILNLQQKQEAIRRQMRNLDEDYERVCKQLQKMQDYLDGKRR